MYRVSDNARTKKTAALICEGLEKCLQIKPLDQIRINDIYKQCYVSRSTFYRLFDSILDVLLYKCNCIIKVSIENFKKNRFNSKMERALFTINSWLASPIFVKTIIDNNLGWLINKAYLDNEDSITELYQIKDMERNERDYFYAILSSLICSTLFVYYHQGENDIVKAYHRVVRSIKKLSDAFDPENQE